MDEQPSFDLHEDSLHHSLYQQQQTHNSHAPEPTLDLDPRPTPHLDPRPKSRSHGAKLEQELTFKKENMYSRVSGGAGRSLFAQANLQSPVQPQLRSLLSNVHSLPQLLQLPHSHPTLLGQPAAPHGLPPRSPTALKLHTLGLALSLRHLGHRRRTCLLEIEALRLHQANEMTEVDRHRLYLLEALALQLSKKMFVDGVKYGAVGRMCARVMAAQQAEEGEEGEEERLFQNQFISNQIRESLEEISREEEEHRESMSINKIHYYQQSRMAIFCQVISQLLNKHMYMGWKKISQSTKRQQENESQHQSQPEEPEFPPQPQYEQMQDKQPIEQIEDYIKTLKKQLRPNASTRQQILRNYFNSWKIHFLNSIIIQLEQEHPLNDNVSGLVSDQSNVQVDLKERKYALRVSLKQGRVREFFRCLSERKAEREIRFITRGYYIENLKKRGFLGLFANKEEEISLRINQEYAQDIAQNQIIDHQGTAKIFYKTNCLAKVFFGLKNSTKYSKFARVTEKIILHFTFNCIKYLFQSQIDEEIKIKRILQISNKKLLFKCFIHLKNMTSNSPFFAQKCEVYKYRRGMQVKQLYFSALKLLVKKKIALQAKVQRMVIGNKARSFFATLKQTRNAYWDGQNKMISVSYVHERSTKSYFMYKFRVFYLSCLKNTQLEVKYAKLELTLLKNIARQGVGLWRKSLIRNRNYSVIQQKLRKLKQLEEKERLFRVWQDRLREKIGQNKKDKLTSDHRLWLNKYYEKLCAIEQEQ